MLYSYLNPFWNFDFSAFSLILLQFLASLSRPGSTIVFPCQGESTFSGPIKGTH